ncbi:MAG: saccharopine dehydrogenase family protein [Chromatocurvus sp.]
MKNIILVGAGKIGGVISEFLAASGDYTVTVADLSEASLATLPPHEAITTLEVDVTDHAALTDAMQGHFAVINALPYQLTAAVARAAAAAGIHYLDLTEDVASTRIVRELAESSDRAFIPQSGLAPGFITMVTHDLTRSFDTLQNVHMRVGALPRYPSNALKYNITWSVEGLINEYCEPCEAIVEGELVSVPPLEELETFSLDGMDYEAFNTSGGLGTLCETLAGKVRNLNYRSVRYVGHRDMMKMLLNDLRLKDRQELLKELMEQALPMTLQDVVLIFVTVSGTRNGVFEQQSYVNKVYGREINGRQRSAIQITTASGVCAVLDLLADGTLPQSGLIRQEDIPFDAFIRNRFGCNFAQETSTEIAA